MNSNEFPIRMNWNDFLVRAIENVLELSKQRGVRPNTQEENTHSKKGERSLTEGWAELEELGVSC